MNVIDVLSLSPWRCGCAFSISMALWVCFPCLPGVVYVLSLSPWRCGCAFSVSLALWKCFPCLPGVVDICVDVLFMALWIFVWM